MEARILNDKNQYPTEEIIFSHIGKSKKLWISLFDFIRLSYPDFEEQWRYYDDGKSWLLKVVKKSKTIFWLSIIKNSFKITFYFSDKSEEAITGSSISDELKNKFINAKRYGKIRSLTILLENQKNIEYVKSLIVLKLRVK